MDYQEKLKQLLIGLEVDKWEEFMEKAPAHDFRTLGQLIAKQAKKAVPTVPYSENN